MKLKGSNMRTINLLMPETSMNKNTLDSTYKLET